MDDYMLCEAEKPAEQWQLDCISMNPSYTSWGNGCDYMYSENMWSAPVTVASIEDGLWELDEYNECVHFYFEISRPTDAVKPQLALQLWIIHPRKGASRGVYIKNIQQSELPTVFEWLNKAASQNAERFSKIPRNVAPQ